MACRIPKLFELLTEKNITAKKLAEAIGASEGNVSDWKSGKAIPSAEKLILIADFFDISLDYLLGRTDNPQGKQSESDPQLAEALQVFSALPSEKRKLALKVIKLFLEDDN